MDFGWGQAKSGGHYELNSYNIFILEQLYNCLNQCT